MEYKYNFKIIAIRILPGCADHIKKCLCENEFYYLCNDYRIENDGAKIVLASNNLKPLDDDFFWIDDNHTGPRINLSAIVGMNGVGKSSLVEVFLRLINNFSIQYKFNPNHTLQHTKGVCAECYFLHNGNFYIIQERDTDFCINKYELNDNSYLMIKSSIEGKEIYSSLFYTLVSNYSIYAYNVEDFHEEFSKEDTSNPDGCWLHHIFHKNDGYQVPISLHPYRDRGDIDINNERELSLQRLLSIYLQSSMADKLVKDKKAFAIKVEDVGFSKLQKYSLRKFFDNRTEYDNILSSRILSLKNILNQNKMNEDERTIVEDNYRFLDFFYVNYLVPNKDFIERYNEWCFREGLLNNSTSDIKNILDLLQSTILVYNLNDTFFEGWSYYWDFNLCQLLHIIYIKEVYDTIISTKIFGSKFKLDNSDIFANYSSMSEELKCKHYMLYKVIKTLETQNVEEPFLWMFQYNNDKSKLKQYSDPSWLDHYLQKLKEEWNNKSHTTLKLRQTYNHLTRLKIKKRIWDCASDMKISCLQEKHAEELIDLENMPPAIYSWDILFKVDGQDKPIPFSSFSSGEKQKLYNIGAIAYHLSNINTSSGDIRYDAVNIILEEIELYFHPEWQRTLVYDLMAMIRQTNLENIKSINIIFVTHSPYILSDIPKTNVLFIKNGKPNYTMQENTFGANINSLLKNGFFMPGLPIGQFAHEKINTMFAKLHSGDFSDENLKRLKQDILLVGEPFIRQQLMTLYNTYSEFNKTAVEEMIVSYLNKYNDND